MLDSKSLSLIISMISLLWRAKRMMCTILKAECYFLQSVPSERRKRDSHIIAIMIRSARDIFQIAVTRSYPGEERF